MLPKSYYLKTDFLKSNDSVSISSNQKKSKKKHLFYTIAVIATLALAYTFGIRKLESKFFKDIAKKIKPEEIYLPELKNITKELTLKSKTGNNINVRYLIPSISSCRFESIRFRKTGTIAAPSPPL